MANELSDIGEKWLLDHLLKRSPLAFTGQRWIGISREDPLDDASLMDEPTPGVGGYNRVQADGATWWGAAVNRQIANNQDIVFGILSAEISGGNMHWVMFDAPTGGNYLGKADIPGNPTFDIGSTPTIPASSFVIGFQAGGLSTVTANQLLEHFMLRTAFSQYDSLFAFLSSTDPGDDFGNLTEPAGADGYGRAPADSWNDVTQGPGTSENSVEIEFPVATNPWLGGSPINYFGLWGTRVSPAADEGVFHGTLSGPLSVAQNEKPRFPIGDFDFSID